MSDSEAPRRHRSFGKQIPEKWLIFAGDCHLINEFLEKKSGKSVFVLLQYINSVLRSFGQVLCANNPISGLIIMIAIASANYQAMFAALMTSSLSFLFAMILQQDVLGNLNGFFGYNSVLHAVVSVGSLPSLYSTISLDEPRFWLFLTLTTLISVYFTTALGNLCRYLSHHPIPCFTLPFNLLQYVLIFCLLNNSVPPKIVGSHLLEPSNFTRSDLAATQKNESFDLSAVSFMDLDNLKRETNNVKRDLEKDVLDNPKWSSNDSLSETKNKSMERNETLMNDTHLNWGETFSGTIVALSQVYGLNNIPCSILMFLALVIYSPTTAMFCYFGSFFGTLLGVSFASNLQDVYNGMWGYNSLLSAGALAGFGFVLTPQSAFLSFIAVLFCTIFQHFITPLFLSLDVPMFHIPFVVTSVIFLLVTSDAEKALPRPGILTYPEKHRQEFKEHEEHLQGYLSRVRTSDNFSS